MKSAFTSASVLLGSLAHSAFAQDSYAGNASSQATLTADMVESMGNNSLFTRWRPQYHFLAPAGWMNDPCGAMYDPTRDTYHLFYQWHPEHINWGNISWGHATSKDLITWTDVGGWEGRNAAALEPTGNGSYNGLGIFSGTAQPVNLQGEVDGTLTIFYTSISKLPTNWQIEYQPYTETQSIAYSEDGGETWQQYENNPYINATTNMPPMSWNLTGFRDPFVEPWPEMDDILGYDEPHYYSVWGAGIKGVGPRVPFWTAPANDLTDWTFLGALWEPDANTTLGPLLSTGTYGFNMEVSGFFSLDDSKGNVHYYAQVGVEVPPGDIEFHPSNHWSLWNEGTVSRRENGSAEFTPIAGGLADSGNAYALTSFYDSKNDRRVQWAWAPEDLGGEDGLFSANQQGFQGSLALPRELFVHETSNVVNSDNGTLTTNRNSVLTQESRGNFTAMTLGIRPLPDVVEGIRNGSTQTSYVGNTYNSSSILSQAGSQHMELKATVRSATGACGLVVACSPDMDEMTTITYQPSNHTILIDRSQSSMIDQFGNHTVTGYFYPYTIVQPDGSEEIESITMDVFLDGSLLEVYVNDRFALATRIYPSMQSSTGYGVYVEDGESAVFDTVSSWSTLYNVWPERPLNTSAELVFDTAEETNNYTWWAGN
ncbi:hypothetical protein MBLNU230_g3607t1 [Neophaeotheca triangularis]